MGSVCEGLNNAARMDTDPTDSSARLRVIEFSQDRQFGYTNALMIYTI